MSDSPPAGTLSHSASAVGLACWGMVALGAWAVTALREPNGRDDDDAPEPNPNHRNPQ